jgi:hypothetical protein
VVRFGTAALRVDLAFAERALVFVEPIVARTRFLDLADAFRLLETAGWTLAETFWTAFAPNEREELEHVLLSRQPADAGIVATVPSTALARSPANNRFLMSFLSIETHTTTMNPAATGFIFTRLPMFG